MSELFMRERRDSVVTKEDPMTLWTAALARYTNRLFIATSFAAIMTACTLVVIYFQLREMKIASEENKEAIKASKIAADSSLQALRVAEDDTILLQRAWLAPVNIGIKPPVEGEALSIIFEYKNIGKEPAQAQINLLWRTQDISSWEGSQVKLGRDFDAECSNTTPSFTKRTVVVYPDTNDSYKSLVTTDEDSGQLLSADRDLIVGNKVLVIRGCIVYSVHKNLAHSSFCYYYLKEKTKPEELYNCGHGGYVD